MLGLLRGHSGHDVSRSKIGTSAPVVTEVIPSPAAERSNPLNGSGSPVANHQQPALLSPVHSVSNSLRVSKRQSSFQNLRGLGSVRASYGRFTNTIVREQHSIVRAKCQREFGASVGDHAFDTSYEGLLEWIRSERMMRLPHKGGLWDRVLISAQYFADQVHHFSHHIHSFTEDSGAATNFVFGQCLILLELGHENASALEKAFNLLYQFGLELSPLLRRADLFAGSHTIMELLGKSFADLLQIVTGIAISFYQAVHSGRPFTKIDIFTSFSSVIEIFRDRVRQCSHEMWDLALIGRNTDGCQVDFLQKWLAPQDSVLAFLSSNHINIACRREEFTCTWFLPHLTSFLKSQDRILLVEGKSGSGKTTLAQWVVDRLQRPIARKHISTISFFYDYNIAAQSTPLAMLKTLLCQLLSIRIGDDNVFDAASEAFLETKPFHTAEEQETKMWHAITKALQAVGDSENEPLAIVVDGVTESDTAMRRTCEKLHEIANKYAGLQLIQFSQPLNQKPKRSTRVKLSAENMIDDIRTVVRRRLQGQEHFRDRDYGDQENMIEEVASAADGSMLWAYLVCKLFQRQRSDKAFDETFKSVIGGSKTSAEIVKKLFVSLELEAESKTLLSLIVTAERPLQLAEAEALLLAEPSTLGMSDKSARLQLVLSHISAFVIASEGLIAIRHDAVKQAILGVAVDGSFSNQLKSRQQDMVMRLLIYAKSSLRADYEPTMTFLGIEQAESRLRSHCLLEYAVRYWALHFKKSLLFKPKGDLQLPKEFKKILSESISFCLLEHACWNYQTFASEAYVLHDIAFRVRKGVFGQDHVCVLQSALFCADMCETTLSRHSDAIEWYALASKISSVVIGMQADITMTCCNILLRISESSITKKRTAIMTYREEVLLILVKCYKHRYGSSSKEVLEIYKKLQELYIYIEEETKAEEIVQIIRKLTVTIYGDHSHEAQLIHRKSEVLLQHHKHTPEIETINGFLFRGYVEEQEQSLTFEYIQIIIEGAAGHISRGEFGRAEELYIELWLKLTEYCQTVHICEWHEKKIEVMLIYAEFLEKRKRYSEASAILVAIWTEYEHHEFAMFESIILLLKKVAVCMKVVKLHAMALLVFQKCWSFFKHQHKEHLEIYREIEEYISRTSVEIVETTTITTQSETVMRTVFESTLTSTESVSITTVKLCNSLTSIYIKEERWSEAVSCIKKMLLKSWSTFYHESFESILMAEFYSSESIKLVKHLAECYIEMRRYEKAEEIYMRLYRAHRNYLKVDNVVVIEYIDNLLKFYATHELFTKAISFYQELLVEYRSHYGADKTMTINVLYKLGELCRSHYTNYGYWLEYYIEIVVNLNKGSLICHKDAFNALIIVAEHYYETLRFSESLVYFRCIFTTFCKHFKEFEYFQQITKVRVLIEHYFRSIEESKIDIHEHVKILKELHVACIENYGKASEVTIHVSLTLAETYCRSEKYQFEAISIYEMIMQHESMVSKEVIRRTETSLKTLYIKQTTRTDTTITKETIERATKLTYRRYIEIRKEYSCSHEITLTNLRELVMLYQKLSQLELAHNELKSIVIDCIMKVSVAKELIEAATTIAAIYISSGSVSHGIELLRELKLQIIYKSIERSSHFGFDVTSIGRSCFAFIAAFEYHLRAIYSISLTTYMSDLIGEYLFYERFVHYISTKATLESVFVCGGRLRYILERTHRIEDFRVIEHKMIQYFMDTQVAVVKSSTKASIKTFVSAVLAYLSHHSMWKSWTAAAGFAGMNKLKILLREHKHHQALELTTCIFRFLMANEGLDDHTEITLGFQLCLMMAGRTDDGSLNSKCSDASCRKNMMDLSRQILAEVFDICEKSNYNLARCQLSELNELIVLVGEQGDMARLEWLLQLLWNSREGQTSWPANTILHLGKRLVQAQFAAGKHAAAIRLCENIVYNVRRVNGVRNHFTVKFHALLASMYTSLALKYIEEASKEGGKSKKHSEDMARTYFRKAIQVHEDVLKQIVSAEDADDDDCDDDDEDDYDTASQKRFGSVNGSTANVAGSGFTWLSKEQELESVRAHIRRLQLALQRYGGWAKPSSEYERLTSRVWGHYGKESNFKLGQDQVLASKWKVDGYGSGKAEGEVKEDEFRAPVTWKVLDAAA